ncbi:MAG TPA: hypothetical protein VI754_13860 [Bacteriovoracaceae bacterium]|nr:hypothetical protein [Bacteriovoracaceae bacterium]
MKRFLVVTSFFFSLTAFANDEYETAKGLRYPEVVASFSQAGVPLIINHFAGLFNGTKTSDETNCSIALGYDAGFAAIQVIPYGEKGFSSLFNKNMIEDVVVNDEMTQFRDDKGRTVTLKYRLNEDIQQSLLLSVKIQVPRAFYDIRQSSIECNIN